jgi:hypothetical protein
MDIIDNYLKFIHNEGKITSIPKKIKKNITSSIRGIIASRTKIGSKATTSSEILQRIERLHQKNHELFLSGRITSNEYMRRVKRLRSLEY